MKPKISSYALALAVTVNLWGASWVFETSAWANPIPPSGVAKPPVKNLCEISIMKCSQNPSVNLAQALNDPANTVTPQACIARATQLQKQCRIPYPVSASFYIAGWLQSFTIIPPTK